MRIWSTIGSQTKTVFTGSRRALSRLPFGASRRTKTSVLFAVAGLLLLAGVGLYFFAGSRPLAVLTGFTGRPERDFQAKMHKWVPAESGERFFDGDAARADALTTAHFRLGKRARLLLKPASQVRFGRRAGTGALGVTVELGQVDVKTDAEALRLASIFGELAIDPKSVVQLRRAGKRLVAEVSLGRLELIDDPPRAFTAGQSVTLEIGGIVVDEEQKVVPAEPLPAPSERALRHPIEGSDLVVVAGETFWVHDPSPPTKVGFRSNVPCDAPLRLSAGTHRVEGTEQVALQVDAGKHQYELRCLGDPERIVGSGQFEILRDRGARPLPTYTPTATVHADGRKYTIFYQERLPQVTVTWPSAPPATAYSVSVDGAAVHSSAPTFGFAAGKLGPGSHELVFSANTTPPRTSRKTTVEIKYDAQAPTARVLEPNDGFAPSDSMRVAGQAMPGFSVALNGKELELDAQRRFSTEASASGTLVLAFSRPGRGTHYYLRRPKERLP